MAFSRIIWFIVLAVIVEASLYDDDYDTYTKAYDYRNAGNSNILVYFVLYFLLMPNGIRTHRLKSYFLRKFIQSLTILSMYVISILHIILFSPLYISREPNVVLSN